MKHHAPATARNREPIRDVLARELPERGLVLELASGTGEHAVFMAAAFPQLEWQPSDPDPVALVSIAAWRDESGLPNLRAPIVLDVTAPWPVAAADVIVCINLIHISPWEATLALFDGASRILPPNGLLYTYGPYRFAGVIAPSNDAFDQSLRSRDSRWGVRDVRDLRAEAELRGFTQQGEVQMPANNHSLIFRRT